MAGAQGGSGSSTPCASCKLLRRRCARDCVFAPYFPPDNPQKFVQVHRVFGASNVTKLLNELHPYQREDAVNSLAYEADMRLRDPVYGCVAVISILQRNLRQLQQDLARAKFELSRYQSAAGQNGQQAAMAEFIGSAVPNGFINVGHSAALGGFGQDQQFSAVQMLSRSYAEGEPIARLGLNGGYEFGYSAGIAGAGSVSGGLGMLGGSPFLKPGIAGTDDRAGAGQ